MKMKNRKGSTLIMTLIVFVVLMIFGTFILGFMVNENKMSLNHQHKTEAYYIARSGAIAVEEAIVKYYDIDQGKTLNSRITEAEQKISIDGLNAIVTIKKIKNGENTDNTQKYLYIINSSGQSNNIKQVVEKVIPIEVTKSTKSVVNIDSPIIYIESQEEVFQKKGGIIGKKESYPNYNFMESFSSIGPYEKVTIFPTKTGNYIVDDTWIVEGRDFHIEGEVNIYVKNKVVFNNVNIYYKTNSSKLNIFIYGDNVGNGNSLELTGGTGQDITMKANYFVKQGNVTFDYHKVNVTGNIVTNGEKVDVVSHSNNNDHVKLNGIIYGPNATITFGKDNKEKGALEIKGGIVGKHLKYDPKNGNDNDGKKISITYDNNGISNPFEDEIYITISKNPGYFK